MYSKWKKRTRREVVAPGAGAGGGGAGAGGGAGPGDDRPIPNVKVNRHVPDEVKGAAALRKAKKAKDNLKLKNLSKDKRRRVEGHKKKKQALEKAASLKGVTKAGNRKIKAILRY